MSLARDAMASGDSIIAENYLQHAEHYNRIIMAAQAQMQQPFDPMGGGMRPRSPEEGAGQDQDGDYDDDDGMPNRDGFQPQHGMRDQQHQQHQQGHRDDRRHRFDRRHEGGGHRPVPGMDDQPEIRGAQNAQPAGGETSPADGEQPPRAQNSEGGFNRDRQEGGNFRGNRRRGRHHGNGLNGERRGDAEPRERMTPPKDEEPVQS